MKSNTFADPAPADKPRSTRLLATTVKAVIAVALLAALFYWGNIDFKALALLFDAPGVIVAVAALTLVTLPLGALRWALILRTLNVGIPFVPLFHIQCIGMASNQVLFGPASADAVRGVYAWRTLGGRTGAIAVSLLADRLFGLIALLLVAGAMIVLQFDRLRLIPQFHALFVPFLVALLVLASAGIAVIIAPALLGRLRRLLSGRQHRIAQMLGAVENILTLLRRSPGRLLIAFMLTILGHLISVAALVLLAVHLKIGALPAIDYATAGPLSYLVNALPLTPGGLGVGEAAFDRICHWLEAGKSNAPYATIFFAYRAVTILVFLTGFISFVFYRPGARR